MESYKMTIDPLEQARRTVVRSFMGFGSNSHNRITGFRSNSRRSGTTPENDWKHYPEALRFIIERMRGVVIENRDALEVLAIQDSNKTLHYVDPPYLPETRDIGVDYKFEMDEKDHINLARILNGLKGMVIVSGYPSALYNELYKNWDKTEKKTYADGAAARTECLWMRNISKGLFSAKDMALEDNSEKSRDF